MNNLQQGKKNCIFAFHYYHYYAKVYRNTPSDSPRLERRRHPVFARMNADPNVMEFFLVHCHRKNHLPFISVFKMSSKPVASVCML